LRNSIQILVFYIKIKRPDSDWETVTHRLPSGKTVAYPYDSFSLAKLASKVLYPPTNRKKENIKVRIYSDYKEQLIDTGEARLHQYIFWEFSYYLSDFRVIDWRRYENVKINPRYDHKQKKWFLRWWDKKDKVIREIWATSFVETKTYVDREVQNHKIWPKEFQRGLLKRRRK
jgi:hypothetical protein